MIIKNVNVSGFDSILPNFGIAAKLVFYPVDLYLVVTQQGALPLSNIDNRTIHLKPQG